MVMIISVHAKFLKIRSLHTEWKIRNFVNNRYNCERIKSKKMNILNIGKKTALFEGLLSVP